ncbi:unnamed protein product [Cyclocybe aegerita]|uniref:Protein kinase domain-containing protein n=1 Tax=Cyclocybe aegerita TaxID=1973307 RepID=A0A8S0VTN1_CYCAE|nr:unnamed protein product [Cyclocybe aegerita]
MHHYKVRWGILLNTRNAIVAYLAGENTLYLSDVITRDAGKDFDSFTLTAAMYTLALTDWRPPTADFSVSFLDLKVEISQLKHQGEHSTAALRGRGNQGCGNRCGTTRASMFTAQRGSAGQQGQERDQDDTGRHDLLGDDCRQLSAFVRAVQAGQVFDRVKFETPATEASSSGSLNPAHLIICGPRPLGEGRAWTVFEGLLTFPNGSSSEMEITSLTVQVVNPRHLQGKLAAPTVPVRSTVIDTGAQALNDGAEDMTKGGYKSLCPSSLPAVSAAGAGDANASPPSELPAAKISPSSSWESRLDGSSLSLPTSLDKSDFSVSQQVAVKICCPRNRCGPYVEQEDLEDGVMWEGRLYDGPLRALQGNAVPHCYGLFSSADEEVFVMVQERLWGPMAESWAMVHDLQAQPVLDAFEALHRAGVLHQDLDPRHVQFASTEGHEGGYRLIDFNLALGPGEWTDEDREQEDRLLRNRLGLLRR